MKRTTKNQRRRENKLIKALAHIAVIIAVSIVALLLLIWCKTQAQPPRMDEELATERQQEQQKPLSIEIPESKTEGSITIYTPDGAVYGYFGKINIINDGTDGHQIEIELNGWLVGECQHGEPAYIE